VLDLVTKKTSKEVVDNDLKCLHLCTSDALDRKKWRLVIRGKQSHSNDESGESG